MMKREPNCPTLRYDGIAIARHGDRLLLRAAVVTASLIASLIRTHCGTTNCRLRPSSAKSTKGRLTPSPRPPRDGEQTPNMAGLAEVKPKHFFALQERITP